VLLLDDRLPPSNDCGGLSNGKSGGETKRQDCACAGVERLERHTKLSQRFIAQHLVIQIAICERLKGFGQVLPWHRRFAPLSIVHRQSARNARQPRSKRRLQEYLLCEVRSVFSRSERCGICLCGANKLAL
jgi:hypothetical protein